MNFQSHASKDGAHYRNVCCEALDRYGFDVLSDKGMRVDDCGVEVDIVAKNRKGVILLIECKGGYDRGQKAGGFKSGDNIKKAIGSAYCLSGSGTHTGSPYTPLIVMTTYMTKVESVSFSQLSVVETRVMADIINDRDSDRLKWWSKLDWYSVEAHIATYPTVTWVATDNPFWQLPRISHYAVTLDAIN